MSNVIGHATLNVVPSTKGFSRDLQNQLSGSAGGATAAGKTAGRGMGAGLIAGVAAAAGPIAFAAAGVAAVGAFAKGAISAAGDLEQSRGAIEAVFAKSAGAVVAHATAASSALGLSAHQYNELATVIGTQLKNAGTAMDDLAPKTDGLITLGGDLSAMFGGTTADAVSALSSALKGERDPIERYGVSLNQAAIDAKAAELGFSKVGGALSAEANQAATLALIMEQTADAHGTMARESTSLQARQQQLAAGWTNLQATIGQAFLPVASGAVGILSELVNAAGPFIQTAGPQLAAAFAPIGQALAQLLPALGQAIPFLTPFGLLFQVLAPVLPTIGAMLGQIASVIGGALVTVVSALTPIMQTLTTLLSGVLAAVLPIIADLFTELAPIIGMAATVVGELLTVIAPLVTQVADLLIPVIQALLPVVTTVFGAVGDIVKGAMTLVRGVIDTVMAVIKGDWSGAWQGIQGILKGAWDMIVGAVKGAIDLVVAVFRDLLPAINKALLGIGEWLLQTGVDLVDGLLRGISSMAGAVWDTLVGIIEDAVGGVLSFLGIHSPSRLFRGIGENIGKGMVNGLHSQTGAVHDAFDALLAPVDPAFGLPAIDVSDGYMARAAAHGALPALGAGPQFTTNYYDNSTSSEDKQAKLQRAQTVLEATVAANPRR